jgi:F420-non-reducing hydrogenase small subunit
MSVKIAIDTLSGCSGCEISLLNAGVGFIRLLQDMEIVHMPILMDNKYFGYNGVEPGIEFPKADIGIICGAVRNEEQLRVAEEMREKCGIVVALGTCAGYGGIPALINLFEDRDLFRRYYRTAEATDAAPNPTETIPTFLERTYALDEKIKVDAWIPGCPPHSDHVSAAIEKLMKGETSVLPTQSVCDSCPAKREGKGSVQRIRRFTRNARYQPDKPLGEMRCLLEQGFLCMGPVTLAGCAGNQGGAPRCIDVRVPCRGCYGPVRRGGNQLLDMLNALASNGIDIRNLPDRLSVLRFSGAHGRLRCPVRKPV